MIDTILLVLITIGVGGNWIHDHWDWWRRRWHDSIRFIKRHKNREAK